MQYTDVLLELGLSPNEAKIYEGLVEIGQAGVPEISVKIGVHKRNVYDTIPRLLQKGLIYQISGSKENKFLAVEPNKLEDLIWENQSKLKNILPNLNAQFKKTSVKEAVYVYKGVEGFKNYLRDILKQGKDVYFVGAKGGWFDQDLQIYIKKFLAEARKKGIKYHHIFDQEIKTLAPELLPQLGKPYKFLPKSRLIT